MASMLDALTEHRVVMLGETHIDDVTHRVEHAVLEGLADRRDDRLVLTMEMFERDVQPVLDRYLAGEIDEAAMLEQARPWTNYRTGYRSLVETARARGIEVRAANAPRSTMMKATGGAEAYQEIRREHPTWLPAEVFAASEAYWARVDRTIRGHGPGRGKDRTYSVQNLWDNTMADAVVEAARTNPEHLVLHVTGSFHIEEHEGTVAQVNRRDRALAPVTISVVPTFDLARVQADPERADFVVYAHDYAQGPRGGALAVAMPSSLDYRLELPDGPPPEGGWPLLVWLPDDEQRSEDAVLRWALTLGAEAAIIVVDPPHRTRAREGWLVQRWAWPSSWSEDLSAAAVGLSRIIEYARRRLPVREAPVVLVGEGAGGTLALWAAQYGTDLRGVEVIAIDPQWPRALRSAVIPDDPSAVERLEVMGAPDDAVLAGLRGATLEPEISAIPAAGGPRDAVVRKALGLADVAPKVQPNPSPPPSPDPAAPMATQARPLDVVLAQPSPLSISWAALYTTMLTARGHQARLVLGDAKGTPKATTLAFDADPSGHAERLLDVFGDAKGLPRTPDVFAGAVVLILPAKVRKPVTERWAALTPTIEAGQGFIKTPYRVVRQGDPKGIATVMDELRSKGRTEVLLVPVELCATADRMQRYFDAVEPAAEGLSLHWLPGLGAHAVRHLQAPKH